MASFALNEHYEKFIKKQLASGRYNNASEVVRTALRMMEDLEEERERWLKAEMPSRYKDLQSDPSQGVPLDTVFSGLQARHQARMARDK